MFKNNIGFLAKQLFYEIKKLSHKKKKIRLEKNVSFYKTSLSRYNRICKNSSIDYSVIGPYSYVGWDSNLTNIKIGSFCSIGPKVEVIKGTHPIDFVSTNPVFYSTRKQCGTSFIAENKFEEFKHVKGTNFSAVIGNDVWIGFGAKIIEGVIIGDGAVVLAGAYVTKNVDPYSIVGGVPAKHVKYRFNHETISKLLDFKWWNQDEKWLRDKAYLFSDPEKFLKELSSHACKRI